MKRFLRWLARFDRIYRSKRFTSNEHKYWLGKNSILICFFLFNGYTFEDAIRDILIRGGATDTNAAIVGGLLGARWGKSGIPEKKIDQEKS